MTRKKTIITLILAGTVLLGTGAYAGRNFIADLRVTKVEQDTSLAETIDQMMLEMNGQLDRSGDFTGSDSFHFGRGQATIYTTDARPVLVFEDDFAVRAGPDLVVYLSKNNVESGEDLGSFVTLGELQSDSGKQIYSLPDDYKDFNSVVVWCRAFGVQFSSADLQ